MSEVRGRFRIINARGLHARAATRLAQLCAGFSSAIHLEKDGQSARAGSVIELLLLCGQPGTHVDVVAIGDDAQQAIDAIGALIGDRFGEAE